MSDSIRPVTIDDVMGLERYEAERDEIRRRTIALKKNRRVGVGDRVTFVFENFDTVFFQVQEMLRAENTTDLDSIREELEVYNALLPAPGGLSATMLIEITDPDGIEERLLELLGIDESLSMDMGDFRILGEFEAGRSREDRMSAVQYVRFRFSDDAIEAFLDETRPVSIRIDHENYTAATAIEGEVRRSLAADLTRAT